MVLGSRRVCFPNVIATQFIRACRAHGRDNTQTDDAVIWLESTATAAPAKKLLIRGDRAYLVVVLQQLDDDLDVSVIVLDGDDTQDVGRVLSIRLLAVLVGQHQASVRLLHLNKQQRALTLRLPAHKLCRPTNVKNFRLLVKNKHAL